jgi:hypothetical protein
MLIATKYRPAPTTIIYSLLYAGRYSECHTGHFTFFPIQPTAAKHEFLRRAQYFNTRNTKHLLRSRLRHYRLMRARNYVRVMLPRGHAIDT